MTDPADPARHLHLVVDRTPPVVRRLLQDACSARGVGYQEVLATRLDPLAPPVPPGDLLFSPATSGAASRAERQLFQPGVATFHLDAMAGPYRYTVDQAALFPRLGLPTPRSVRVVSAARRDLEEAVAHVGGLPVVLKAGGSEGGVGVMRLEDLDTLAMVAGALLAQGAMLRLLGWVPDAMHWRCVVVGDRVVAAYRNPVGPDGVRSQPSDDPDDHGLTPSDEMASLAVDAARAEGTAFAGVDILEHPSGRLYLLEANFPCYFPTSTEVRPDVDVAGPMVDWLVARAEALTNQQVP